MAKVPDTNTFSLQDVVDVVEPSEESLQGCFDDADEDGFDSAYEGDKDRLYNFRNYEVKSFTASGDLTWLGGPGNTWTYNYTVTNLTGDPITVYFRFNTYNPESNTQTSQSLTAFQWLSGGGSHSASSEPLTWKVYARLDTNFTEDDVVSSGSF